MATEGNFNLMMAVNDVYMSAKEELKQAKLEIQSTPYMDYKLRNEVNHRRYLNLHKMQEAELWLIKHHALTDEQLNRLLHECI